MAMRMLSTVVLGTANEVAAFLTLSLLLQIELVSHYLSPLLAPSPLGRTPCLRAAVSLR